MSAQKRTIPVLSIQFVADHEHQYELEINRLKAEIGITDGCGYNMGVKTCVVVDQDEVTLVGYKDDKEVVIPIQYSSHTDDGEHGSEDYYFIGSKEDPNDHLLVVACVRKYAPD